MQQTATRPPQDNTAPAFDPWRRRFVPATLRRDRLAGQVVRFGLVGVLNTVIDFGLFNLLHSGLGVPLLLANTVSVAAGIVNSFLWNKHWTFSSGDTDCWQREAAAFLAVSVSGLILNDLAFYALHGLVGGSTPLAVNVEKLAASIVSMTWNFVGYRFLAFPMRRVRGTG